MNAAWHQRHVMPKSATAAERVAWHREHQQACACRPVPASLRAAVAGSGGDTDDPRMGAVAAALAGEPGVSTGGRGFGATALKVGGKIFAMRSSKGAFVVKLPRARVDELVAAGRGARFDPGKGTLMKEWFVPEGGRTSALTALAREALAYVGGPGRTKPVRARG